MPHPLPGPQVRLRRRPRARLTAAGVLVAVGSALLAGCGGGTEQDSAAVQEFRDRAAAGTAATWSAQYRLDTRDQKDAGTVDVQRAGDALRLDVRTDQGVATSITGERGVVSCQRSPGRSVVCVALGPTPTPGTALDPALRGVLVGTLPAIASGAGDVEVLGPSDDARFPGATCARVSGDGLADGVYCLFPSGVPASANFPSGSIAWVKDLPPPASPAFTPPAPPRTAP